MVLEMNENLQETKLYVETNKYHNFCMSHHHLWTTPLNVIYVNFKKNQINFFLNH